MLVFLDQKFEVLFIATPYILHHLLMYRLFVDLTTTSTAITEIRGHPSRSLRTIYRKITGDDPLQSVLSLVFIHIPTSDSHTRFQDLSRFH